MIPFNFFGFGGPFNKDPQLLGIKAPKNTLAPIKKVELETFLKMKFPPRRHILAPWLPDQGITMVYAPRGVGKTQFALGVADAVTTGGTFLKWQAPKPRSVLYIDGEMPANLLQERFSQLQSANTDCERAPLHIITPDLQTGQIINLSDRKDQVRIEAEAKDVDLIIVDNIATLCRGGNENDTEGWAPVQEWALRMRSMGKSIIFIHHSGKQGQQRGASAREDVMDTVIHLKHPKGYSPKDGAVFEVHFTKARGFYGDDAEPFEASLHVGEDGKFKWRINTPEPDKKAQVVSLFNGGMEQTKIASELNLHKSTVSRHISEAKSKGLITA